MDLHLPLRRALSAIVLALILSQRSSGHCASKEVESVQSALSARFVGKDFTLRKRPGISGTMHAPVGTNEYVCDIDTGPLSPLPSELGNVRITKISQEQETEVVGRQTTTATTERRGAANTDDQITVSVNYWRFALKHPALGRARLRVTTASGELPKNAEEVAAALSYVLQGGDLGEPALYATRPGMKLVHYICSGHAPSSGDAITFRTYEEAKEKGYRACRLCFNEILYLPHLSTEFMLGKEAEAMIRRNSRVLYFDERLERVERVGHNVLQNWPGKLKGYKYRFYILDEEDINAAACPGGCVFVNRGLLETMENDDELEAVLAHEIAHVEQRHGLMAYLKAQRDARTAAVVATIISVGAAAGAAAAGNGEGVQIASAAGMASLLLVRMAQMMAVSGYSINQELEADVYSLVYLQKRNLTKAPLAEVLKKLRSSQELEETLAGSKLQSTTHPKIKERFHVMNTLQVRALDENRIYDAYNKDGELVYSVVLTANSLHEKRDGKKTHTVLGEITATAMLGEAKSFDTLTIQTSSGVVKLKTDASTTIAPMDTLHVSFQRTGSGLKFIEGETKVSVDVFSAARIVLRGSEGNATGSP